MTDGPLLAVEDLSVSFPASRGGRTRVLDRVAFDVRRSETVALVGESGSGKTVTALSIMGLGNRRAKVEGGRILLGGADLLRLDEAERRSYRGKRIAMVFQSPKTSLNPLVRVGDQIARVVMLHRRLGAKAAAEVGLELMASVGINHARHRYDAYAHQLSGGMAQRIAIAMALAAEPEVLIADEPTTGLDVTIQQQIFTVLFELQQRLQMSILLITHDLALVAETCDRVSVMHAGRIVEMASVEAVFDAPKHPYTRRLLGSVLRADRRTEHPARAESGSDGLVYTNVGCRYVSRCEHAFGPCSTERPRMIEVGATHLALCHLYDPRSVEQQAGSRMHGGFPARA